MILDDELLEFDEEEQLLVWEADRMTFDCGLPYSLAVDLAHKKVSWHAVHDLIVKGCPPELAAEIAR